MNDHYFSAQPVGRAKRRTITAEIWSREFTFQTADGVFAKDGLDKATAVLLRNSVPPTGAVTVLDLGCGWGPIACAIAVANPQAEVWAVDTNERALELTAQNAQALGVTVNTRLPRDVPQDLHFNEIWSNPPIRIGKAPLHELLLTWLPRLKLGGSARLVVGKHLGSDSLQRWLNSEGWPTERVMSAQGFRILNVSHAH